MSHPHRLLPNTAPTFKCLSCVSLLMTGFPVTPPEPGPAPSSASGFRPSGLCTPVSPGVPTGARNLGVCVFSCFAPNLCHCLSLVVSFSTSLYSLVLRSHCRPEPNLCYSTLVPSHPRSTPSSATAPPTFVYSFFPRTLVFPQHTSYEPHGSSVSPVWDLRRRWVMLTVGTETEPVPTCVLSPPSTETSSPPSFALYSSLLTHNNTV